jgi:hypothetical protein
LFLPLFEEVVVDVYSYRYIFGKVVGLVQLSDFIFDILLKPFVELAYECIFSLTNMGSELLEVGYIG